eukprot:12923494-Prorocentrum_lima.AAC.1
MHIGGLVHGLGDTKVQAHLLLEAFSQESTTNTMGTSKVTQACGLTGFDNLDHGLVVLGQDQ